MSTVRCCWCGATLRLESLQIDENGFYCPICKHDKFDPRPEAQHLSALYLKPHVLTFAYNGTDFDTDLDTDFDTVFYTKEIIEDGPVRVRPLKFVPVQ